jgi:3-hydroxyacyl-[acyl-carrier-protein] dehydratase
MDSPENSGSIADLDVLEVMEHIPHRYPFLLIDRLVDIVPNESAVGVKNVTINEPFFQGHFPTRPIMPGVLIVEAMAQAAGCLVVHSMGLKGKNRLVYFMSIENARFRKPVVPGDQLRVYVVRERNRANVWRFRGEAKVDGSLVAEATYTAMIASE